MSMETSKSTARELYEAVKANPTRPRFGFGRKPLLVNIDLQCAYTQVGRFATAYETNPRQIDLVNELAQLARERRLPVVWTYVAYMDTAADCGVWGTRTDTPDSLQNIKIDSERSRFDPRLVIDRSTEAVINKRMASAFHETNLQSLMVWYQCDSVVVTGGSTSGCVRATVVDSLSRGYRTIVPEECVADKHESPHFANLYDMVMKYADVIPVAEVLAFYRDYTPPV
jgi:maleamate amidohydrolase